MSLNGLDTTEVNVAYQTAVAEAGGWLVILTMDLMTANNTLPEQVPPQVHIQR